MVATLVGGALAAGGANAINMVVDRDIDRVMHRTRNRPLVTGAVTPGAALIFALGLEVAAFVELWLAVNLLSAVLAVSATAFYVFVYTLWLKRRSSQNIVIGGAAGAVPVLVGWAAVTGSLAWPPVVLFAIIFIWTPPHFWALAVRYREDYQAADVPMLPVVASMRPDHREILLYTVALVAMTLVFAPVAHMGVLYVVAAAVLGAIYIALAARLWGRARRDGPRPATPCGCSSTRSPTSRSCSSPWPSTSSSGTTDAGAGTTPAVASLDPDPSDGGEGGAGRGGRGRRLRWPSRGTSPTSPGLPRGRGGRGHRPGHRAVHRGGHP